MIEMKFRTRDLCLTAMIAAIYAALTLGLQAISFGPVQFRVSEALTLLPILFPQAIPGLTLGCLISNLFSPLGATVYDVVFGTLATLVAAILTRCIKGSVWVKALPPVPDCWFTVVMPDYGVSTPEAFAAYDRVGSSTHPDCEAQEAAIRAEDLAGVCAAAGNALEECSGARDNETIKTALQEQGAITALMTGSGAAVFGIFADEASARAAAAAVQARWPQVYVAQPDRGGARVIAPRGN